MLELFLLRHGKASNPEKYDKDYDRPLRKKGVVQINQLGFHMKNEKINPRQIISSKAKRTHETTAIANHFIQIQNVSFYEDLYLANYEKILKSIEENAEEKSLLYVGHNFGISNLASYLSGEKISMSTGMLIKMTFEFDDWKLISAKTGTVDYTFTPDTYIP